MKGPLSNLFDPLVRSGRLSETYRFYILTNITCLLLLVGLVGPVMEMRHERADAEKVVIASRIAEEVIREVGNGGRERQEIPAEILSRYEEDLVATAGFCADTRIIDDWHDGETRVAVSVSWQSSGEQKRITIVRSLEMSASTSDLTAAHSP